MTLSDSIRTLSSLLPVRRRIQRGLARAAALSLLLLLGTSAQAAPVEHLYSARVAGEALGAPSEQQLREGLAQVLIKLSGRGDIMTQPESRTLLENATLLLMDSEVDEGQRRLTFAPEQLSGLMQSLGLPVLGADRPELLVWLVEWRGESADYATAAEETLQRLRDAAERRGLPLRQPLLDLDDQLTLPPQALAALSAPEILQASNRYQPDAVLVGILGEGPTADAAPATMAAAPNWVLWQGNNRFEYHIGSSAELLRLIDQVADRLFIGNGSPGELALPTEPDPLLDPLTAPDTGATDAQALQYPVQQSGQQSGQYNPLAPLPAQERLSVLPGQTLIVRGVDGTADYIALVNWLRDQPGILAVHTAAVGTDELRLSVQTEAGTSLQQLPIYGERLQAQADGSFRWQGAPATPEEWPAPQ